MLDLILGFLMVFLFAMVAGILESEQKRARWSARIFLFLVCAAVGWQFAEHSAVNDENLFLPMFFFGLALTFSTAAVGLIAEIGYQKLRSRKS